MIKSKYVYLFGILLVGLFLNVEVAQAQQKTVLVLKNGVLTPVPVNSSGQQSSPTQKDTHKVAKAPVKKAAPAPVVKAPAPKPAPIVKAPAPKPAPVVKAPAPKPAPVVKAPAPKPAPVVAKAPVKKGPIVEQVDYIKRVQYVHNLVCSRIPQNIIDSIGEINHFLLDSIRHEIAKHRDKDSINFLKVALSNGLNDSLTLININSLVNSAKGSEPTQTTGAIKTYCIDLATQSPMDSVKVSIYSHDSLITTSYSDNTGFCKISGLNPGEYSLAFSKNNYTPFSDRWVKVSAGNVTYLEMPLSESPRFYLPKFSAQIWAMIIIGVISVFVLVYSIIRRLGRVA